MNPLMNAMGMNRNTNGNQFSNLMNIARMVKSGNPEQIAMNLMRQNHQFKQFVEQNRGKTPEQVARENGIDFSQIRNLM